MVTYHQSYGDPFLSVISIFSSIVSAGLGSLPCILKVTLFISCAHNFAKSLSTCPGWRWHTLPCPISHSHWNMKVSLYNQRRKNTHLVTMNGCSRSFVYFGRTASSFMRQRLTKFMKSIVKIFSTPLLLDVSWGGSPCTTLRHIYLGLGGEAGFPYKSHPSIPKINLCELLEHRVPLGVWKFPCCQLDQGDSKTPDITSHIVTTSPLGVDPLRSHIGSATGVPCLCNAIHELSRDAEVAELDSPWFVEQDVTGLDITMHDLQLLFQVAEGFHCINSDLAWGGKFVLCNS